MSGTHGIAATRRDLLKATGALLLSFTIPALEVARARAAAPPATLPTDQVDSFLAISGDGTVTACCGHVDLGTGARTALAQIVAEELDVAVARVNMVLGDTDRTPDQGPTIASATIQVAAVPLRQAAARARQFLVEQAAHRLGVVSEVLVVRDGVVYARDLRQGRFPTVSLLRGEDLISAFRETSLSSSRRTIPWSAPRRLVWISRPK